MFASVARVNTNKDHQNKKEKKRTPEPPNASHTSSITLDITLRSCFRPTPPPAANPSSTLPAAFAQSASYQVCLSGWCRFNLKPILRFIFAFICFLNSVCFDSFLFSFCLVHGFRSANCSRKSTGDFSLMDNWTYNFTLLSFLRRKIRISPLLGSRFSVLWFFVIILFMEWCYTK